MNHFDVVIVGAGISGVSAAVHLQKMCPSKTWTILEGRDALGGTWDLFRYPGIRSDSDMHTLGFNFKPWIADKAIADGPAILSYVNETVDEFGLRDNIQLGHKVKSAAWSSEDSKWTIGMERSDGSQAQMTASFLLMCGGYYNYDTPHDAGFKGMDDYRGEIIHPQFWPENMTYEGKKIVVIGSGATAMTIVPSMAELGAEVTMVQRTPTYVVSAPDKDKIANTLRKILPGSWAYAITRLKNTMLQHWFYHKTRVSPEAVKRKLLGLVRKHLGPDYDVDKHFTPPYNPWDQRLCLIPNADLFKSINNGSVKVVTEQIDCFVEDGLKLATGEVLPADAIVTATGLKLIVLSGVDFQVDGKQVDIPETFSYKGMMYSDIPNMAQTFGYINASWTLRADLTSEYVCRLLNYMDELGMAQVTPRLREEDKNMEAKPWIDDFPAGYMKRSMHLFPKQGGDPWRNTQNYKLDKKMVKKAPIADSALQFSNPVSELKTSADGSEEKASQAA